MLLARLLYSVLNAGGFHSKIINFSHTILTAL